MAYLQLKTYWKNWNFWTLPKIMVHSNLFNISYYHWKLSMTPGPTAVSTSQAMGKIFENPKFFWKFLKFVLQWHLGMKSSPYEFYQKIRIHLREIEGWKLTNFDHPNEIFSTFLFIIFEGLLNGNIKIVNFETFKILWSVY